MYPYNILYGRQLMKVLIYFALTVGWKLIRECQTEPPPSLSIRGLTGLKNA